MAKRPAPTNGHGDMPIDDDSGGAEREVDEVLRSRTVQLGAVVFVLSLITAATAERVALGVNLFTAQLVVVVSAAMMLLRTIHKLSRAT